MRRGGPKASLGALCVGALLACDEAPEMELRDTEQRTFSAVCPEAEPCVLKQKSGPEWPGPTTLPVLHSEGRLVAICSQPPGTQEVDARRCRAIQCTRHRDCPPAHGQPHGACLDGLCSEPAGSFGQFDAVVRCLAGLGLGYDSPKQVENYALAVNCGSPCELPKPCRN